MKTPIILALLAATLLFGCFHAQQAGGGAKTTATPGLTAEPTAILPGGGGPAATPAGTAAPTSQATAAPGEISDSEIEEALGGEEDTGVGEEELTQID